jgi:hypothetical protein
MVSDCQAALHHHHQRDRLFQKASPYLIAAMPHTNAATKQNAATWYPLARTIDVVLKQAVTRPNTNPHPKRMRFSLASGGSK